MKNIFKNAYFGKPYKTRDDKKALYLFGNGCGVYCITENFQNKIRYYHFNGIPYDFENSKYRGEDIISEWQEQINEKKLNKIAKESFPYFFNDDIDIWEEAYIAGYHKALGYLTNNKK